MELTPREKEARFLCTLVGAGVMFALSALILNLVLGNVFGVVFACISLSCFSYSIWWANNR